MYNCLYLFDMKNKLTDIGQRIRLIRTELGLSQSALGNKLGLTGAAISKYENGESDAGAITLSKIAHEGEKSLDWLITGQESQTNVLAKLPPDQAAKALSVLEKHPGTERVNTEIKSGWKNKPTPADLTLIKQVIEAVEEHLQHNKLTMPPDKIAELIEVLYEEISESGAEQVNKGTVARMIRLVI